MNSFSSILNTPATASVRPPAVPGGHYIMMIRGLPRQDKSSKKGTEFIEYTCAILQPYTDEAGNCDVDPQALEEFGSVQGKEMRLTFYMTEASAYRHTEFLTNDLGLDIEGASHWEAAQSAPGAQFVAMVRQKPREDGKGVYSEIGGTAPLAA